MKRIFLACFLCTVCLSLLAQDDQFTKFKNESNNAFSQFVEQNSNRFDRFRDSLNAVFAAELERRWEQFSVYKGVVQAPKPEPKVPVVAEPAPVTAPENRLPIEKVTSPTKESGSANQPATLLPVTAALPATSATTMESASLRFYDCPLSYEVAHSFQWPRLSGITEKDVAAMWRSLASVEVEHVLRQCNEEREKLSLCDWGTFKLVSAFAQRIYPDNVNEQSVFVVYALSQFGFAAKVGRIQVQSNTRPSLVCLIKTLQQVYSVPYVDVDEYAYYVFSPDARSLNDIISLYSYSVNLSENLTPLNLRITKAVDLDRAPQVSVFRKNVLGHTVEIPFSKGLVAFYADYPSVDLALHASAVPEKRWTQSMDSLFRPWLKGMSQTQAVSTLLDFMYACFDYSRDNDQFGFEKYFFCEENFFYKANDCEDRAILFSFFVKRYTGLDVVLLNYPKHVAAAVCFDGTGVNGDYVLYRNKKYVVCDPTYINAGIGRAMPECWDAPVEIITW